MLIKSLIVVGVSFIGSIFNNFDIVFGINRKYYLWFSRFLKKLFDLKKGAECKQS